MENKKAFVYLRVSTDKQAEKGFSLPAQEEACRTYAAARGLIVAHIFKDEGESARSSDRPQLQEMMSRCGENGIAAVIVHKVDRLARNTLDHAVIVNHLRKRKIQLLSVIENLNESPHGLLLEGILASFAEFQSTNLAMEVLKGMSERAKQGMWNTKAPLGYRNMKEIAPEGTERKYVAPDPSKSNLIIRVFEMFATGQYTAAELSDWLYSQGIKQKYGDKLLSPSVICRMLQNKFYIGLIHWNGIEAEGMHEPIIPKELFQRVQIVLEDRVHGRSKKRKNLFLLRGLMTCGECGGNITYEKQVTSSGRIIPYYRCSKKHGGRPVFCSQSYVEAKTLEEQVYKALHAARLPAHIVAKVEKKLKEIHEREQESVSKERKQLLARVDQLNEKERSLVNKYLENKITDEIYETVREEIASERITCKARLEANESTIQAAIRVLEQAVIFARNLPVAYKRADDALKRRMLSVVFKEMVVKDGGLHKVVLNEPLDYFCRDLVANKNTPVKFDGGAFGDPTGNRTPICRMRTCRPNH